MSVCRKLPDGTVQKIAGHTILLDANAAEIRSGTIQFNGVAAGGTKRVDVTFSDPMPDTDYIIIFNEITTHSHNFYNIYSSTKTTTGFSCSVTSTYSSSLDITYEYYAFKLVKLDGYTALQNKVNNPDASPTEDSLNLVTSGGVYEAIENNKNTLKFNDVVVTTSAWVADATYSNFGFKAVINCENVTADYMADVVFDCDDATSGTFAPVSSTGAGTVTIYANSVPNSDITIPTILCTK